MTRFETNKFCFLKKNNVPPSKVQKFYISPSHCFFNNIRFKVIGAESKSVTKQMIPSWEVTTLPTLLSKYDLKNIFNADKFGLFYQCLPNKTYHFKGQKCTVCNRQVQEPSLLYAHKIFTL